MTKMLMIDEVVKLCEQWGRPFAAKTWTGYVSRGTAPQPDERIGRTPRWEESTIIKWLKDEA